MRPVPATFLLIPPLLAAAAGLSVLSGSGRASAATPTPAIRPVATPTPTGEEIERALRARQEGENKNLLQRAGEAVQGALAGAAATVVQQIFRIAIPAETLASFLDELIGRQARESARDVSQLPGWVQSVVSYATLDLTGRPVLEERARQGLTLAVLLLVPAFLLRLLIHHWNRLVGEPDDPIRVAADWVGAVLLAMAAGPLVQLAAGLGLSIGAQMGLKSPAEASRDIAEAMVRRFLTSPLMAFNPLGFLDVLAQIGAVLVAITLMGILAYGVMAWGVGVQLLAYLGPPVAVLSAVPPMRWARGLWLRALVLIALLPAVMSMAMTAVSEAGIRTMAGTWSGLMGGFSSLFWALGALTLTSTLTGLLGRVTLEGGIQAVSGTVRAVAQVTGLAVAVAGGAAAAAAGAAGAAGGAGAAGAGTAGISPLQAAAALAHLSGHRGLGGALSTLAVGQSLAAREEALRQRLLGPPDWREAFPELAAGEQGEVLRRGAAAAGALGVSPPTVRAFLEQVGRWAQGRGLPPLSPAEALRRDPEGVVRAAAAWAARGSPPLADLPSADRAALLAPLARIPGMEGLTESDTAATLEAMARLSGWTLPPAARHRLAAVLEAAGMRPLDLQGPLGLVAALPAWIPRPTPAELMIRFPERMPEAIRIWQERPDLPLSEWPAARLADLLEALGAPELRTLAGALRAYLPPGRLDPTAGDFLEEAELLLDHLRAHGLPVSPGAFLQEAAGSEAFRWEALRGLLGFRDPEDVWAAAFEGLRPEGIEAAAWEMRPLLQSLGGTPHQALWDYYRRWQEENGGVRAFGEWLAVLRPFLEDPAEWPNVLEQARTRWPLRGRRLG